MPTLEEMQQRQKSLQDLYPTLHPRQQGRVQSQIDYLGNQINQMQENPPVVPLPTNPMAPDAPQGAQNLIDATPPLEPAAMPPEQSTAGLQASLTGGQFASPQGYQTFNQGSERTVNLDNTKSGGFETAQSMQNKAQAQAGVPGQIVAQGSVPFQKSTTTVSQPSVQIPEALKNELTDTTARELQIDQRKENIENIGNQMAEQREAMATELSTFEQAAKEREATFQEALKQDEEVWKQESAELAKEKIDSSRFWGDMSTGKKIASAIAITLGSLGSALAGGRNLAADMILKAASDDVKDQVRNLDSRKQKSKGDWQKLQAKRQLFKSDEAFQKDLLSTRLNALTGKIQSIQEKAKSQEQVAALEELKTKIGQEAVKNRMELIKLETPQTRTTETAIELSNQALKSKQKGGTQKSEDPRKLIVPGVGVALTAQDAKDLKASKAAYDSTRQGLAELRKNIKNQFESLPEAAGGTKGKVETAAAGIKAQYKQLMKLGTLDQGVENIFKQLLGSLSSPFVTEASKLEKLKQFEKEIEANFMNNVKARVVPGQNLIEQQRAAEQMKNNQAQNFRNKFSQ